MKIKIVAIGKSREGPERSVFELYRMRLAKGSVTLIELKNQKTAALEGEELLKHINKDEPLLALDEHGEDLSTRELAAVLETFELQGTKELAFVIGGADGLSEPVKARATRCLRFGRMTWPHFLVRALLVEQLYRIQQIKTGHPYHRD